MILFHISLIAFFYTFPILLRILEACLFVLVCSTGSSETTCYEVVVSATSGSYTAVCGAFADGFPLILAFGKFPQF